VAVPPGVACQDEAGRLWDVLWLLRCAVRRSNGSTIAYGVLVRNSNRRGTAPLVRLKAGCGPGDDGEPVITVLLPDQWGRHLCTASSNLRTSSSGGSPSGSGRRPPSAGARARTSASASAYRARISSSGRRASSRACAQTS
jgi:hypothetical protein